MTTESKNANNNANNTINDKAQAKAESMKKREFILNKTVSAESVQPIIVGINEINAHDNEQQEKDPNYVRKPIKLIIDSFGGSIYCGFALANTVDTSETPVHTYCLGKAMSMGFLIFVVGHKRFAHPNATLMYHDAGTSLGDTVEGIQQSLNQTKKIVRAGDNMITNYTNIKQTKLDRIKREKKNWYMFATEGFELGVVDELLVSTRKKHRETT